MREKDLTFQLLLVFDEYYEMPEQDQRGSFLSRTKTKINVPFPGSVTTYDKRERE